jgi:hypothetical protein
VFRLPRDGLGDLAVGASEAVRVADAGEGVAAVGFDELAAPYPDIGGADQVVGGQDRAAVGENVFEGAVQFGAVAGVAAQRPR